METMKIRKSKAKLGVISAPGKPVRAWVKDHTLYFQVNRRRQPPYSIPLADIYATLSQELPLT